MKKSSQKVADLNSAPKNQLTSKKGMSDGVASILASLVCILIGIIFGYIALLMINPEAAFSEGLSKILQGGFYRLPSLSGLGTQISRSAALIMTGLSVAFAFKTGLFNIGAAGQYVLGAFGALYFALILGMPWYVCLIMSAIFGAVWGAIPGIFKAYFNVNEVITSIMFNWIGLYLVNYISYGGGYGEMYDKLTTKTYTVSSKNPSALIPDLGLADMFSRSTTIAIFIAIAIAILMYIILNKTTFGFELKACGLNKSAAKYVGINEKRNVILAMAISGALAGLGAGLFYLSGVEEWNPQVSTSLPAMGFNGISVALLALSNPIGVIFSALFISHITVGGTYLDAMVFPREIADIIIGIIIYLCAFSMFFKDKIKKIFLPKVRVNANEVQETIDDSKIVQEENKEGDE